MRSAIDKSTVWRIVAACVVPFAVYPTLVALARIAESHQQGEVESPFLPVIDLLLPLLSAVVGFAFIAWRFRRRVVAFAVVYFPVMMAGLLFFGLGVVGFAWRDFP